MTTTWYPGDDPDDPITDAGGYLPCGCHASQSEHSCRDEVRGRSRRENMRQTHALRRRRGW